MVTFNDALTVLSMALLTVEVLVVGLEVCIAFAGRGRIWIRNMSKALVALAFVFTDISTILAARDENYSVHVKALVVAVP